MQAERDWAPYQAVSSPPAAAAAMQKALHQWLREIEDATWWTSFSELLRACQLGAFIKQKKIALLGDPLPNIGSAAMDRFESMSVLLTVVKAGSLSAAARQLGMPLASVSRRISELEAHLRTRLLNRSSRRLSLTDAGQSYVAACRRILEEVDE